MSEPEGLISQREAARRLGVGRWTIRKLIRAGELRAFRVRTAIRISPFDLRQYLNRHPADRGNAPGGAANGAT
ncbi:helix-turn-helix domain-containing protein [Candidatus Binatus sp.]|uniref:helix-turn-helix domain-containing protein n=1 Tax=Candidatus Binatus sp. TaxID=2811406 RepID=UPI002F954018